MFSLEKRAYFTTLGELRMLLAGFPNETKVCTIGVYGSYLHIEEDESLISFDTEELFDDYPEFARDDYDEVFTNKEERERMEHCSRIRKLGLDS